MTTDTANSQDEFQAVDAAYTFVVPSYQLLTSRFEAADNRLTHLLTLALSLALGAPTLAKAIRPELPLLAPLFIGALTLAAACVVLGIVGRVSGSIVLPDPSVIYEKSLRRTEHSFKMTQIYYAGENFNTNARAVRKKGNVATAMTVVLAWAIVLFIVWFAK
jgi:hypothetical protein